MNWVNSTSYRLSIQHPNFLANELYPSLVEQHPRTHALCPCWNHRQVSCTLWYKPAMCSSAVPSCHTYAELLEMSLITTWKTKWQWKMSVMSVPQRRHTFKKYLLLCQCSYFHCFHSMLMKFRLVSQSWNWRRQTHTQHPLGLCSRKLEIPWTTCKFEQTDMHKNHITNARILQKCGGNTWKYYRWEIHETPACTGARFSKLICMRGSSALMINQKESATSPGAIERETRQVTQTPHYTEKRLSHLTETSLNIQRLSISGMFFF